MMGGMEQVIFIAQDWGDSVEGVYATLEAAVEALGGRKPYPGDDPDAHPGYCVKGWAFPMSVQSSAEAEADPLISEPARPSHVGG